MTVEGEEMAQWLRVLLPLRIHVSTTHIRQLIKGFNTSAFNRYLHCVPIAIHRTKIKIKLLSLLWLDFSIMQIYSLWHINCYYSLKLLGYYLRCYRLVLKWKKEIQILNPLMNDSSEQRYRRWQCIKSYWNILLLWWNKEWGLDIQQFQSGH